jgi:hypothetical protein
MQSADYGVLSFQAARSMSYRREGLDGRPGKSYHVCIGQADFEDDCTTVT